MQTLQLNVILSSCKTIPITAQCLVYVIRSEIQTPCILFARVFVCLVQFIESSSPPNKLEHSPK
jgi:hypothetical protein